MNYSLLFAPLLFLIACTPDAAEPPAEVISFDDLIACNDAAVGGDALRQIQQVEYDLHIKEPAFEVEGTYVANRAGTARIDIFADGERVFSEGWDGETGWQQPQGETTPQPTSAEGGAALRHGLEQPGHLWTLRDMPRHGHTLREDTTAVAEDGERIAHLTLADGFETWYGLDTETCLITRKRNFRAFHPDVDSTQTWIESHFADHRTQDGVTRAWTSHTLDLATGDTIATTQILAVRTTPGSR